MKKIIYFIKNLFNQVFTNITDLIKQHAHTAVMITQKLKEVIDSPIADLITAIIPGDLDNKIVRKLRKILPIIIKKTTLALNIVEQDATHSQIISATLDYLKEATKEKRTLFLITFSAELNKALADDKIDLSEAIVLSQIVYKELKENKSI